MSVEWQADDCRHADTARHGDTRHAAPPPDPHRAFSLLTSTHSLRKGAKMEKSLACLAFTHACVCGGGGGAVCKDGWKLHEVVAIGGGGSVC